MRIIIVGATGTIGCGVAEALSERHEIVRVGRTQGDFTVDITDPRSIEQFYKSVGSFDALIATVGHVAFKPLPALTREDFEKSFWDKILGQIELVRIGMQTITSGGSFTLTSGVINRDPIPMGVAAAVADAAIDGFVTSAAQEMPRGIRINAVSPTIVAEAWKNFGSFFRGFTPVPLSQVALAYVKSVEGLQTGKIFTVP